MSKCPGLYFDIGKKARDVLHKDYVRQPPIHFHCHLFDWNLDLSCQIEEVVPGLRSLFRFVIPDSGKVELQYLHDYIGITGCLGLMGNPLRGYEPVVNLSGVVGTTVISLGANLAFDFLTRAFNKLDAGLSFNTSFLVASLTLNDKFDSVKASCYHAVNPLTKTAIAAEIKHNFTVKDTAVTIGAQHAIFPFTVLKARMDSHGNAGVVIHQELWRRIFLCFAGEVDFGAINRSPKFGFSMTL